MDEIKIAELLKNVMRGFAEGDSAMIEDAVSTAMEDPESDGGPIEVVSYAEGGYLTSDQGFVVRIRDAEYAITVTRNR